MKRNLLDFLICPHCEGNLRLRILSEVDREIEEGTLMCAICRNEYFIVNGIPRFVKGEQYAGSFGHQWNKYARLQLDSLNRTTFSEQRFYSITEWKPYDLKCKLVLDAGCGAGRFSEIILKTGAQVVAVDLSTAIDACRRNLMQFHNLHCVQASINEMPFRNGTFDFAFSIGVVQHTPNPREAVLAVAEKVKPGGKLGFWTYELSWKSFVGTVGFKYLLRPITKKMETNTLEKFSARLEQLCWPINRVFRNKGRLGKMVMRLLPVSCADLHDLPLSSAEFRDWVRLDTFDMYSPLYDKPQRFTTIRNWLESIGCKVDPRHPQGGVSITATKSEPPPRALAVPDTSK